MTQRTIIAVLGAICLVLLGYTVATTYLSGAKLAEEWERATETYVQEYHRWLSTSPASGWARVEALATGPEWDRIEKLKPTRQEPTAWHYGSGTYRSLGQLGGTALVQADYTIERDQEVKPVVEVYLLENTVGGIKVAQLVGGKCDR